MRYDRVTLTGDAKDFAGRLRGLVAAQESVGEVVTAIVNAVRADGDDAVRSYTRRFDTDGAEPPKLRVDEQQLDGAAERLDPDVRRGLEWAIENVTRVGEATLREDRRVAFEHHEVVVRETPVQRAAVYVPGGRAPYPSTVVMGVTTARVAGVQQVVVCAPPVRGLTVDPVVLGACRLTGASEVYAMGGAQAIAALAYGTESVTPVDVIVGPGNLYVQEAKQQVADHVGIDGFAGPSDLLVIADHDVDAGTVALDLLAQAEHGPGTIVVAVSSSAPLLDEVEAALGEGDDTGAIACLVKVEDLEAALALAEAFAPEHLELIGREAESLAPQITRAGCLFVGANAATAFGDYIAGSNHILPTGGSARFTSALTPERFRRSFNEVRIAEANELAVHGAPVARAEGFEVHARSMEARIRNNGGR